MSFSLSLDRLASRKASYKAVTNVNLSQKARREQALEEQKKRRQRSVEAQRHLDAFADLDLGPSDDELEPEAEVIREGIGQFAPMLSIPTDHNSNSNPPNVQISPTSPPLDPAPTSAPKQQRKSKKKRQKNKRKASKWANKCMYAELLEMYEDHTCSPFQHHSPQDGLPDDLETGWVALAPVPVGKRCLAVSQQSAGVSGTVPNTILRSRVLGKILISPFPSSLPPSTILDCILDENWKANGLLHVLDVIRWKGQNIADCEAAFRFWWRDTRLSELSQASPPHAFDFKTPQNLNVTPQASDPNAQCYQFSYPTNLVAIPYISPTSYDTLVRTVIPAARSTHSIPIQTRQPPTNMNMNMNTTMSQSDMELDLDFSSSSLSASAADVKPDGLLLYVAQASYESGTTPLSTWVPIRNYVERAEPQNDMESMTVTLSDQGDEEGPLSVFERLVLNRLQSSAANHSEMPVLPDVSMDS